LLESERFGHERGAFTGAVAAHKGLFEAADGGVLFLDEIGDVPLQTQVRLLRALQEGEIRPVGATRSRTVDVRVLCATNVDLERAMRDGKFREDLYYRINVIEIRVPALRDHPQDIPALADHFLKRLGEESGMEAPLLSPAALATLEHYSFPGNVRELENILERAFTLCEHQRIEPRDLRLSAESMPAATAPGNPPHRHSPAPHDSLPSEADILAAGNLEKYLEDIERAVLERTLLATRWNKTLAAERLGLSFRQIRYKLKKLGIE
jgi:two-component system response regulator PilR (NtrC family)